MHRPHEGHIEIRPAHALGDGQFCQRILDQRLKQIDSGFAGLRMSVYQPGALVGFLPFQVFDFHAAGTREAERCLSRFSGRIETGRQRRAAPFQHLIRLRRR